MPTIATAPATSRNAPARTNMRVTSARPSPAPKTNNNNTPPTSTTLQHHSGMTYPYASRISRPPMKQAPKAVNNRQRVDKPQSNTQPAVPTKTWTPPTPVNGLSFADVLRKASTPLNVKVSYSPPGAHNTKPVNGTCVLTFLEPSASSSSRRTSPIRRPQPTPWAKIAEAARAKLERIERRAATEQTATEASVVTPEPPTTQPSPLSESSQPSEVVISIATSPKLPVGTIDLTTKDEPAVKGDLPVDTLCAPQPVVAAAGNVVSDLEASVKATLDATVGEIELSESSRSPTPSAESVASSNGDAASVTSFEVPSVPVSPEPSLIFSEPQGTASWTSTTAATPAAATSKDTPHSHKALFLHTRECAIQNFRPLWAVESYLRLPLAPFHRPACPKPFNWAEDGITPTWFLNYLPVWYHLRQHEFGNVLQAMREPQVTWGSPQACLSATNQLRRFDANVNRGHSYLWCLTYQFCLDLGLSQDHGTLVTDLITTSTVMARIALESGMLDMALSTRPSATRPIVGVKYASKTLRAGLAVIHDMMGSRGVPQYFNMIVAWLVLPWVQRAIDVNIRPTMFGQPREDIMRMIDFNIAKIHRHI